ncbi:MAG: hypothetical protein DMG28_05390 [Acidobacteria bacterium]|nr:MAG: hypothetical protein DMG28_05390 [Acidobacteriota bacterium]
MLIETCLECGAVNAEHATRCSFCGAALASSEEIPGTAIPCAPGAGRSAPAAGKLAIGVDWRTEVSNRLEAYRARRRREHPSDSQPALPFGTEGSEPDHSSNGARDSESIPQVAYLIAHAGATGSGSSDTSPPDRVGQAPSGQSGHAAAPARRDRNSQAERVEIAVLQPEFDFAGAEAHRSGKWPRRGLPGEAPLLPVAELADRWRAGRIDAAILLLAYAGFLALFGLLGGHFGFRKVDAAVCVAMLVLFHAQYFALFTLCGGSTPGMRTCGLRVATFDGAPPRLGQLLWRSFGYLVSGGTLLLGFLWALWDEDHLTWHDRISQTYVTHSEFLIEKGSTGVIAESQRLAAEK